MVRRIAFLVVTLSVSICGASLGQSSIGPTVNIITQPDGAVTRAGQWTAAVLSHQPGIRDAAFSTVRAWPGDGVELLLVELASIRRLLKDPGTKVFPFPIELEGMGGSRRGSVLRETEIRYSRSERETLERAAQSIVNAGLSPTDFVARAIVLHTDIARFDRAAGDLYMFTDGQAMDRGPSGADHWHMARMLGDTLKKGDGRDPDLAFWYRATLAHMAAIQWWSASHTRAAVERFENDPDVSYLAGCLHERLAAPATQESLAASGYVVRDQVRIGSTGSELAEAASRLKQAIDRNGAHLEARLHYGRVLTLSDKPAAAIPELRRALAGLVEPRQRYYAELFLGAALEGNRQWAEAKAAYTSAATLFPEAQAPRLALSQLAASRGDRDGAAQAIAPVLTASPPHRVDPWWQYYTSCGRDADSLLEEAARRLTTVRR